MRLDFLQDNGFSTVPSYIQAPVVALDQWYRELHPHPSCIAKTPTCVHDYTPVGELIGGSGRLHRRATIYCVHKPPAYGPNQPAILRVTCPFR